MCIILLYIDKNDNNNNALEKIQKKNMYFNKHHCKTIQNLKVFIPKYNF